ncbi:MAG: hypothetical protein ACOVQM_19750, partial [Pirellula sp.]
MPVTRRGFTLGVASSAATLCSGFAGELFIGAVHAEGNANPKKTRILFNENPLGPSPLSPAAIESH